MSVADGGRKPPARASCSRTLFSLTVRRQPPRRRPGSLLCLHLTQTVEAAYPSGEILTNTPIGSSWPSEHEQSGLDLESFLFAGAPLVGSSIARLENRRGSAWRIQPAASPAELGYLRPLMSSSFGVSVFRLAALRRRAGRRGLSQPHPRAQRSPAPFDEESTSPPASSGGSSGWGITGAVDREPHRWPAWQSRQSPISMECCTACHAPRERPKTHDWDRCWGGWERIYAVCVARRLAKMPARPLRGDLPLGWRACAAWPRELGLLQAALAGAELQPGVLLDLRPRLGPGPLRAAAPGPGARHRATCEIAFFGMKLRLASTVCALFAGAGPRQRDQRVDRHQRELLPRAQLVHAASKIPAIRSRPTRRGQIPASSFAWLQAVLHAGTAIAGSIDPALSPAARKEPGGEGAGEPDQALAHQHRENDDPVRITPHPVPARGRQRWR